MKQIVIAVYLFALCLCPAGADAQTILYVNSYHPELHWSSGIIRGFKEVMDRHPEIRVSYIHMDTKRHPSEEAIYRSVEIARNLIEKEKPDLIIAADDNASKYLIAPHVKQTSVPVVFCGVNWSCDDYGFPTKTITGMIEVQLIPQILDTLRLFARGQRIGFIKGDDLSARKEAAFYEKRFNIVIDKRFVSDFATWKQNYLDCQTTCDMLLLGNAASIRNWDSAEARSLVFEATRIPSGNWDEWMKDFSLVTFATVPEEQGQWAAETALAILNGKAPSEIPVVTNTKARRILNMTLARKLGVHFPMDLIEDSQFVEELSHD